MDRRALWTQLRSRMHSASNRWLERFTQLSNSERVQKILLNPQLAFEEISASMQKIGGKHAGALMTACISTYFLADISSLTIARSIPEPEQHGHYPHTKLQPLTPEDGLIIMRNIFNSQGKVPGEEADSLTDSPQDNAPPTKSTLPLNLLGTLVLKTAALSIATIEDKAANKVYPVRAEDSIPGKLRVLEVLATRVVFINDTTRKKEYIELPDDAKSITNNARIAPKPTGIERVSTNQFTVSRIEVDKSLADLNNILTQARAVPNFENGIANGYKFFQIVPGSIYDKLGIKNGDVISGLNGQPVTDPGKAFEMMTELKTSNHLELQINRDGKPSTYTYDIR